MVITHNLSSMNALNKLTANTKQLAGVSEKLSSGFRINRSADDASGLAVSEKMRSQLHGLKQASKNCQDGINLVQTFEGALGESHGMIQRAKELAAESANGSYDDPVDRAAIELEYEQLCKEINNIADTDFNGVCMLNGGKLASAKPNGLLYASPIDLKWQDNSFVNNTDDPDFDMTITPLPAMNGMSIVTEDEKEALQELNGANVSVSLENGTPVFKFNAPIPKYLTIETDGVKGVISMKCGGSLTPVAEVNVSGIDISYNSIGKGTWGTSSGGITVNVPTSENPLNKGKKLSASTTDPQSAGSDIKTPEEAMRKEYHDWLSSIPGKDKMSFKVTDDRKNFTIVNGAEMLRVRDENGVLVNCQKDEEYPCGTTLYITTDNKNCNTSEKDYIWKDWSFSVSWTESIVKPGATLYLTTQKCTSPSPSGQTIYGSQLPDNKGRLSYGLSLSWGLSLGCIPNEPPKNDDNTNIHSFWERHGAYSFSFSYDVTKHSWSATINDKKSTKTYVETTAEFNEIKKLLNISETSMKSVKDTIEAAHAAGYFTSSSFSKYDKEYWPHVDRSIYTFSWSLSYPSFSSNHATSWYANGTDTGLRLDVYNPNNPDKGGIEADKAPVGTFTYKNHDLVNTINEGYWVDENGNVVDLEEIGIHLPKKYTKNVLSSEEDDYKNNVYTPLHDGLSITVNSVITGPTGTASATVQLWQDEGKFIPMYDADLKDTGLTYSENLLIQSNARSKDIVKFTFDYASQGIGELVCNMNCSAQGLGMNLLSLETQKAANDAIDKLDYALNKVSMVRACLGATQNRLANKVENIAVSNENITESESYIRDADMAVHLMDYTKSQILSSAAQTMLSQSNLSPQQILRLLE